MEQLKQSSQQEKVSNIEDARIEEIRFNLEKKLSADVKRFDTGLSVKVKYENGQLFVTLFQNEKWKFDAYIVDRPLSVKLEGKETTPEDHIFNMASMILRKYIDNPEEVRQFEQRKVA